MSDFTYQDKTGATKSLADNANPSQSEYTADGAATGDVTGPATLTSGTPANRADYTYKDGAGNTATLGDAPIDMTQTITLNSTYTSGATVDVTNGTAGTFSGKMYTFTDTDTGTEYTLSDDGTALVHNNIVTDPSAIAPGSALETAFNNANAAYNADKTLIDNAVTETTTQWADEQTNFANADAIFNTDVAKIAELDGYWATVQPAQDLQTAAFGAKQDAENAHTAASDALNAAMDLYTAPIATTIADGANAEIDTALADGGKIKNELDTKANADDVYTKAETDSAIDTEVTRATAAEDALDTRLTTAEGTISTHTSQIDALGTRMDTAEGTIDTHTTQIDALGTRMDTAEGTIDTHTTQIDALDTRLGTAETTIDTHTTQIDALDTRLTDEVTARENGDIETLQQANAYTDASVANAGAMALKSANAYTDERVNDLEKDMSSGIASAAALSSVAVSNVKRGEVSVGGGYGYHNSQSAVAFGAAMGLTDNWSANAGVGISGSNATFRAGTNYKFKLF